MKNLLMATDLSARSDRALERAVEVARVTGAKLTVLHVVDDALPSAAADAQEQFARTAIRGHVDSLTKRGQPKVTINVVAGRPYAQIFEAAEKSNAEMIVLGMHRENALKDMFRGTTVERVIRTGHLPVLLVKDRCTKPYRRVVIGVDFSVCSRRAIEFAVEFLPKAEFQLIHAYDVPFKGFGYGERTRIAAEAEHQAQFEEIVESEMKTLVAGLKGKRPRLTPVMHQGTVWSVLDRQIRRVKPDLLVIGTHGRTGVAHALLGSVAEDLLRQPPCDVLAVKGW